MKMEKKNLFLSMWSFFSEMRENFYLALDENSVLSDEICFYMPLQYIMSMSSNPTTFFLLSSKSRF